MRAAVFLFAAFAWRAQADDPCALHTSCKTCAGINGCGWCSLPVTFEDGTTGPQCAGPATSDKKFTCSGLYSTSQCVQGWICDQASGTCREALPGQGVQREKCQASCTAGPTQDVYGCLNGTKTCVIVPAGTPGSGSKKQCNDGCWAPTAPVYKCNNATQKCEEVPTGTSGSSSQDVCVARGCDTGDWKCDPVDLKCVEGDGKQSAAICDGICKEQNDPCENYDTCSSCLAAGPECGWCSENVTYANGRKGTRCAGVRTDILPFQCLGTYSTENCTGPVPSPTPAPAGPSPLPPRINCPKGSTVLLQYSCNTTDCSNCDFVDGKPVECLEPYCTLYCSGQCQPVPAFKTSFMWTCNAMDPAHPTKWTNATIVHYTKYDDCTGPINPQDGTYGGGTFDLDSCNGIGPNVPPQFNTFRCVPCGDACDWH